MNDTFVRVSVFFADRQLDVSLPLSRPAVDIVSDVVDLFNRDPSSGEGRTADAQQAIATADTHTWVLSAPKAGTIEPHATLADYDAQDGDKFFLTRREEAAHTPFVDDAIAEVRATIESAQWGWSDGVRTSGALATVATAVTLFAALAAGGLWDATMPLSSTQVAQVAVLVTSGVVGLGLALWRPHEWMRFGGYALPVVALVLSHVFLAPLSPDQAVPWTVAAVALSMAPGVWVAGRRSQPGGLAGITAALLFAVAAAAVAGVTTAGANIFAVFAWSAWLPVLLLLVAPSAGLNAAGLPALIRQNDTGDPVARSAIRAKALRAEAVSRGVAWAATGYALAAAACLTASPVWQHGLIALLLTVAVLLRQNGFADARIVATLSIVGIVSLAMAAGAFVRWFQHSWQPLADPTVWWVPTQSADVLVWVAAAVTLLTSVVVSLAIKLRKRDDVQEARMARVVNTIDVLVCLTVIPGILAAQGLYQYYWATT